MGPRGYSLLLQTGETADGILPLVDRQHPHDALIELSASFRAEIDEGVWAFLYAAPVGSPALGPEPYMHRPSGALNPVAPISHHFLDATHVTHGVLTAGVFNDRLKAEASWFKGREPDIDRWVPDAPALDSWAVRLTLMPGSSWAMQGSFAALDEPERLHPALDIYRSTLSVMHHAELAPDLSLSTTLAWGRNDRPRTTMTIAEARTRLSPPLLEHYLGVAQLPPGAEDSLLLLFDKRTQSAVLAESTLSWGRARVFARLERARKDELFPPPDLRHSTPYWVSKLDGGLVGEVASAGGVRMALGASASVYWLPDDLAAAYGDASRAWMLFARIDL